MLEIICIFYECGVLLIVGFDLLNFWMILGVSLYWELELFVLMGIILVEVIFIVIRNGVKVFGIEEVMGIIEVGKRVDILVFKVDLIVFIFNICKIEYVFFVGKYYKFGVFF